MKKIKEIIGVATAIAGNPGLDSLGNLAKLFGDYDKIKDSINKNIEARKDVILMIMLTYIEQDGNPRQTLDVLNQRKVQYTYFDIVSVGYYNLFKSFVSSYQEIENEVIENHNTTIFYSFKNNAEIMNQTMRDLIASKSSVKEPTIQEDVSSLDSLLAKLKKDKVKFNLPRISSRLNINKLAYGRIYNNYLIPNITYSIPILRTYLSFIANNILADENANLRKNIYGEDTSLVNLFLSNDGLIKNDGKYFSVIKAENYKQVGDIFKVFQIPNFQAFADKLNNVETYKEIVQILQKAINNKEVLNKFISYIVGKEGVGVNPEEIINNLKLALNSPAKNYKVNGISINRGKLITFNNIKDKQVSDLIDIFKQNNKTFQGVITGVHITLANGNEGLIEENHNQFLGLISNIDKIFSNNAGVFLESKYNSFNKLYENFKSILSYKYKDNTHNIVLGESDTKSLLALKEIVENYPLSNTLYISSFNGLIKRTIYEFLDELK